MAKYKLITEEEYKKYKSIHKKYIKLADDYFFIHSDIIHIRILTEAYCNLSRCNPEYSKSDIFNLIYDNAQNLMTKSTDIINSLKLNISTE